LTKNSRANFMRRLFLDPVLRAQPVRGLSTSSASFVWMSAERGSRF